LGATQTSQQSHFSQEALAVQERQEKAASAAAGATPLARSDNFFKDAVKRGQELAKLVGGDLVRQKRCLDAKDSILSEETRVSAAAKKAPKRKHSLVSCSVSTEKGRHCARKKGAYDH